MNKNTLWSLRLGYSGKQAAAIEKNGIAGFLDNSFAAKFETKTPAFLADSPKSFDLLYTTKKKLKESDPDGSKAFLEKERQIPMQLKGWWVDNMIGSEFPLREKMTCFWHNHFVSAYQKVKLSHYIFDHNMILRENAFGNFKTITKKIVQSNAMVRYLDNVDNRKDKRNENLSRELLELFTLGIGNYTEDDVKNGAKGLAGLGFGENHAVYKPAFETNEPFIYLGKTGNFKADEMIDIIFEQPEIPYLLTRKILKWFIYDLPDEKLVKYYGDYLKARNFEIKPLLVKIFTEEYKKHNAGSMIKDPLVYITQLLDELNVKNVDGKALASFSTQQGMDLFNQPNVKGWNGGKSWLTPQILLQRNNVGDLLISGRSFNKQLLKNPGTDENVMEQKSLLKVSLDWNRKGNNKEIISELKDRLLFGADPDTQADFEKILKHDFDPDAEGAQIAILQLFNVIVKTPEYQLI